MIACTLVRLCISVCTLKRPCWSVYVYCYVRARLGLRIYACACVHRLVRQFQSVCMYSRTTLSMCLYLSHCACVLSVFLCTVVCLFQNGCVYSCARMSKCLRKLLCTHVLLFCVLLSSFFSMFTFVLLRLCNSFRMYSCATISYSLFFPVVLCVSDCT